MGERVRRCRRTKGQEQRRNTSRAIRCTSLPRTRVLEHEQTVGHVADHHREEADERARGTNGVRRRIARGADSSIQPSDQQG